MNIRALKSGVRALLLSGSLFLVVLHLVQQVDASSSLLSFAVACFFIPSIISAVVEIMRAIVSESYQNRFSDKKPA